MNLKCLIINGSPHKGNTWTLAQVVKEQMKKTSADSIEFEEVQLSQLDLPLCKACNTCFFYGEDRCPHHEAVQWLVKKVEESDAVIITTSCYSLNVTALTKNFIDHMSYNFHRPRFFTKKMLVISTTAGAGASYCTKYIRNVFMFWGFNRGYRLAFAVRSIGGYRPTPKVLDKCNRVAVKFTRDIMGGKCHPASMKRVMYYNVWRAMSNTGTPEENADNRYWEQSGLRKVSFSKKVPLNPCKRLCGNLLYRIMKKVILQPQKK